MPQPNNPGPPDFVDQLKAEAQANKPTEQEKLDHRTVHAEKFMGTKK
jgi:hypothetical protein